MSRVNGIHCLIVSDGTKQFKAADPGCIHNVTKRIHVGCLAAQHSVRDPSLDSVFPIAHHEFVRGGGIRDKPKGLFNYNNFMSTKKVSNTDFYCEKHKASR